MLVFRGTPPKFNNKSPWKMVHGRLYVFLLGFGNFSGVNSLLNFGGCNCLSLSVTYQKKDPPSFCHSERDLISLFGGAPSPKLTASLPLKMDGWKMILSFLSLNRGHYITNSKQCTFTGKPTQIYHTFASTLNPPKKMGVFLMTSVEMSQKFWKDPS